MKCVSGTPLGSLQRSRRPPSWIRGRERNKEGGKLGNGGREMGGRERREGRRRGERDRKWKRRKGRGETRPSF